MSHHYLRTSDLAKAVGVHPNTVRLYEQWGFLPPIPRSPTGYRLFTQAHLDQMRLTRLALRCTWLGGAIRQAALDAIHRGAAGDLAGALAAAREVMIGLQAEHLQAEAAADFLQRWAQGSVSEPLAESVRIAEAADLVHATADMLRNWERNGLLRVPRDPTSGYRRYGPAEIGRLRVIRMLLRSGYSTMAVLRTLLHVERGETENLREILDTPSLDEAGMSYDDVVYYASDHWLSTLAELEQAAADLVALLEGLIAESYPMTSAVSEISKA